MRRKLAYGLLLLCTLAIAVTREAEFPRFLLAFELVFPVVSALWIRWMARRLTVSLSLSQESIHRGDCVDVRIRVENPTWFPVGEITGELAVRDFNAPLAPGEKRMSVGIGAAGRGIDTWQVRIEPAHCGLAGVSFEGARVLDCIGLCSVRLHHLPAERLVSVLPRIYRVELERETGMPGSTEYAQDAVADVVGSDTQEIFDTRFYQIGDMLRAIHWKLSAKEDDLLVKEFSKPANTALIVLADCGTPHPEAVARDQMDQFLECTASVLAMLLEEGQPCELRWYDQGDQELHAVHMEAQEELYPALEELLAVAPYHESESGRLFSAEEQEGDGEPLHITLDGCPAVKKLDSDWTD